MLATSILPFAIAHWPSILLVALALHLLHNKFYAGLSRYPGPRLAAYTNWWRFWEQYLTRRTERTHLALHAEHGDIVRIGPNVLSFADPRALKTIYGLNKGMTKSAFYPIQQATAKGHRLESMFSTRSEEYHARYRRCINAAFTMSQMVGYEPLVDSTTSVYIAKTKEYFVNRGERCDMSRWMQFFAFDVIGELTWSKRLGYIERNEDVDGVIGVIGGFLSYSSVVGQMPWLDLLWDKNPIKMQMQRWGWNKKVFPVTRFALDRAAERSAEMEKVRATGKVEQKEGRGIDLITKFNLAAHDHAEFMTDAQVLASCTSMIIAGSETTAISLSSIFYFLLRHPDAYAKLMKELDEAAANGIIAERDNHQVSWAEAQKLPYLDAVIQESFRLHPAAGLILERVTPPEGITIADTFVPGGVIVGCNAWVLHRRPELFGEDVESFRPERWLEASPEQLKLMRATMFQFGGGSRTCLGKNISLLEIYKLVPTFLRNFTVHMDCEDWKTKNGWFVTQKEFWTKFTPRDVPASA